MEIQVKRFNDSGESTLGLLYVDQKFFGFTLEDTWRDEKIKHETCIPIGRYRVNQNKIDTPMTKRYRKKYSWFNYHLEIKNVPNFHNVYIHIGNDKDDTSGCLLVADQCNNNSVKKGFAGSSTGCFKRFYATVNEALEIGDVWINISEEFTR